jgi:hypothetical protein
MNKTVAGVCFKHNNLKKYVLWSLKLMEDMPAIFSKLEYLNQYEGYSKDKNVSKPEIKFDFYMVDDLDMAKKVFGEDSTLVHMKNMPESGSQSLHEIEIMASTGFLSLVGLTSVPVTQPDLKGKW